MCSGKYLYVLTELHSTVFIYTLGNDSYPIKPLPDAELSIVPPSVPASQAKFMDAAELAYHPSIENVLYASNRGELHLKEKTKEAYQNGGPPEGDSIAILLLSSDGSKIESIKYVLTGCDFIRGMSVSPDGKFVAIAGQKAGGVEVYSIGGARGDEWKLAAKNEEVEMVTDLVWV